MRNVCVPAFGSDTGIEPRILPSALDLDVRARADVVRELIPAGEVRLPRRVRLPIGDGRIHVLEVADTERVGANALPLALFERSSSRRR